MNKWIPGEINTIEEMELACNLFISNPVIADMEPIQKYVYFKDFLSKSFKVNLSYSESEKVIYRKIYAPQHFN